MPGIESLAPERTDTSRGLSRAPKRFPSWDLNVLVGYKGVGVDVKSGTKDIETDLIYHGPVLKFGLEF